MALAGSTRQRQAGRQQAAAGTSRHRQTVAGEKAGASNHTPGNDMQQHAAAGSSRHQQPASREGRQRQAMAGTSRHTQATAGRQARNAFARNHDNLD